ncbi:hypothetical protein BO71DRAFT_17595 [Aspergillus ellipticus CBS 707.79]|uniref:Uncharacterized protein n=1 Tax=Aspergillus ellipticus CBS 707.79 TaxID=1448320 RepID=A0A319DEY1_9EURO|nr:hypothetical protein BO71DRAFT_17595 [Aspergillus ellipticus CBS 707.79]
MASLTSMACHCPARSGLAGIMTKARLVLFGGELTLGGIDPPGTLVSFLPSIPHSSPTHLGLPPTPCLWAPLAESLTPLSLRGSMQGLVRVLENASGRRKKTKKVKRKKKKKKKSLRVMTYLRCVTCLTLNRRLRNAPTCVMMLLLYQNFQMLPLLVMFLCARKMRNAEETERTPNLFMHVLFTHYIPLYCCP